MNFVRAVGPAPFIRFVLGALMMLGALVFWVAPLRALLRIAGGDLNGITGLAGFLLELEPASFFWRNGFSLGRARTISGPAAYTSYLSVIFSILLTISVAVGPAFSIFQPMAPVQCMLQLSLA